MENIIPLACSDFRLKTIFCRHVTELNKNERHYSSNNIYLGSFNRL